MRKIISRKLDEIEQAHGQKTGYKVGKKVAKALFFLLKVGFKCIVFLVAFLFMRSDPRDYYDNKDDNRGPDDIWGLTSGDDYYDQKPPDSFS